MSQADNIPHKDDSMDLKSSYLDYVESADDNLEENYQAIRKEISDADVDIKTEDYSINKPQRTTIRAKIIP